MAQGPTAPPPDGGVEAGLRERFGPLAIERLLKADGRALLVYSRAEPQERHERTEERARP
jgi:hypothetical protein